MKNVKVKVYDVISILFLMFCALVGFLTGQDDGVNMPTVAVSVCYGGLLGGIAMCAYKFFTRAAGWAWWLLLAGVIFGVSGLVLSLLC